MSSDSTFAGSIPEFYERCMVPLIFETYALDMAARVAARTPKRVLEVAAGTGVVTRQLAKVLPLTSMISATDLNEAMISHAASIGTVRNVEWRQADVVRLPFADDSFDAVVCQFGVMFFPEKVKAFTEIRRVLRTGGTFLFSVWGRIDQNEFADVVTEALGKFFPDDPPRFMVRGPHGYHDQRVIRAHLADAGFTSVEFTTVTARSYAEAADIPARAYCQGTPLRNEIEARAPSRLAEATAFVANAIERKFGPAPLDTKIEADIIVVTK